MASVRVRTLVKGSAIIAASNAGARLVNFLLLPVYTAALPPDAYGVSDMVILLAWLLMAVASCQVSWGLQAFWPDGRSDGYHGHLVSTCLAFSIGAAALVSLSAALSVPMAAALFGDRSYGRIVALGLAYAAVLLVTEPLETATRMRGHMRAFATFNLARVLSLVAATLLAIFVMRQGAASLVLGNLAAAGVAAVLFLREGWPLLSARAVDLALLKKVLICSAPVILAVTLVWANNFSDRYVIARFLTKEDVGLYGIGTRMMGVVTVFAWGLIKAYGPFASANANGAERENYRLSFDLAAMALAVAAFFVSAFSKEIVALMTAPEYHVAYVTIPFLLYGVSFCVLAQLVGYSFTIRKAGKSTLSVYAICAVANLGLNLTLVPHFGFAAASATTFASYLLLFALSLRAGERIFPCGYDLKRMTLAMAIPGLTVYPLLRFCGWLPKALALAAVVAFVGILYAGRVALVYGQGREWLQRRLAPYA